MRAIAASAEGGVEIPWKIFSGDSSDVLAALVHLRAIKDSIDVDDQSAIASYFRDHIHRGLGYLASGKETSSLGDLFGRWLGRRSRFEDLSPMPL